MQDNPAMASYPASHVNNPAVLAQSTNMGSVNSALGIDRYGQVGAKSINWHEFSGTGGALDFMRGAFDAPGGRSILVLYETAKNGAVSRIVPRPTNRIGLLLSQSDCWHRLASCKLIPHRSGQGRWPLSFHAWCCPGADLASGRN